MWAEQRACVCVVFLCAGASHRRKFSSFCSSYTWSSHNCERTRACVCVCVYVWTYRACLCECACVHVRCIHVLFIIHVKLTAHSWAWLRVCHCSYYSQYITSILLFILSSCLATAPSHPFGLRSCCLCYDFVRWYCRTNLCVNRLGQKSMRLLDLVIDALHSFAHWLLANIH